MADPTFLVDNAARAAREAEMGNAAWGSFQNGMNNGGSNACGIGINIGGGALAGTEEQFTLLDQTGAARAPQNSQIIGGDPVPIEFGTNPTNAEKEAADPSVDGDVTVVGQATLTTLEGGWGAAPVAVSEPEPDPVV